MLQIIDAVTQITQNVAIIRDENRSRTGTTCACVIVLALQEGHANHILARCVNFEVARESIIGFDRHSNRAFPKFRSEAP